jgi:hypothetical protein
MLALRRYSGDQKENDIIRSAWVGPRSVVEHAPGDTCYNVKMFNRAGGLVGNFELPSLEVLNLSTKADEKTLRLRPWPCRPRTSAKW